jgi:mannose-6-phosphate isomerase-like protein (cupin superfamily)
MFLNYLDVFAISEATVQLREGGVAEPTSVKGTTDAGAWTVAVFRADDSRALHPDVWECHPTGNEVLCALSGVLHVFLRDHDPDVPALTLASGEAFIVPVGAWHRLEVGEPAELLAITPRAGTLHERTGATP